MNDENAYITIDLDGISEDCRMEMHVSSYLIHHTDGLFSIFATTKSGKNVTIDIWTYDVR